MTTQQTDIEKTLKRILARELKEWPQIAISHPLRQANDNSLYISGLETPSGLPFYLDITVRGSIDPLSSVTRAEWEAERALLASEQAQPLGDSEEFDQALWDKVAVAALNGMLSCTIQPQSGADMFARDAAFLADAFMAERAKRIAARKASHG